MSWVFFPSFRLFLKRRVDARNKWMGAWGRTGLRDFYEDAGPRE